MTVPTIGMTFGALLLAIIGTIGPPRVHAGGGPDTLSDSTWVDRWTLKNGLEVTVRHIPRGDAVAMIAAWRVGRDQDPKDRDGMADLLSELLLTAAAGDVPERTREEMATLRPRGWNLQVAPRFTLLSEVATPAQFPGVLRQLSTRMRGVTVTDSILARARQTVLRDMGDRYFGSPELMLFSRIRDVGLGVSDEALLRRIGGQTIKSVTRREASDRLNRLYVPANAVLALAGNLEGVDVRVLVRGLFEDIPAGVAIQEPPPPDLVAAGRTIRRPSLERPLGAVGVIAPAITDSTHPGFYLTALLIGRYCESAWGVAPAPLPGRFRYPVLSDPQIVQFFPPVEGSQADADRLGYRFSDAIEALAGTVVEPSAFIELRVNHAWLLGGPLTPPFLARIRQHAGTLHTLANTMAVRALWGSEEFWAGYLRRFMESSMEEGEQFLTRFRSLKHHIRLLLTPAKS